MAASILFPLYKILVHVAAEPSGYVLCCPILQLAELHAYLFSRRASPLEVNVFVAVDGRGEDVMSDEICRRCNENSKGGVVAEVCSSQTGL